MSAVVASSLPALLLEGNYINNSLVRASGPNSYSHVNPSTGQIQRVMRLASRDDVDAAVKSSKVAFATWKRTSPVERRHLLQGISTALRAQVEEFATINALEVGTPLSFGRWAVSDAAEWFDYYAGWTDKIVGDTI